MNAPTPFAPDWVTVIWRADWSKYFTGKYEAWWQLELIAIRYADANKKEIRRQRNIAKYAPQIAA